MAIPCKQQWPIPILLGISTFILTFVSLDDPGISWDEASPNIPAALNQAEWIKNLGNLPAPFSQETIDRYWETTSDHPAFARTCAAISYLLFHSFLGETKSLRLPSALWFGILVCAVSLLAGRLRGKLASLVAGLALLGMPRVFGHMHIFSLDVPIAALWFLAILIFTWSLANPRRSVIAATVFAFAFATKLHAVFLPPVFALVFFAAWIERPAERRALWLGLGIGSVAALLLVPLIYLGTQPWLWHDTGFRILDRFGAYTQKVPTHPIPLWYLGVRYVGHTPWHYPLVMTAVTVPIFILLLAGCGFANLVRMRRKSGELVWLATIGGGWFIPLTLVLLPLAQAYDGIRLFLPSFPWLAIMAGLGADALERYARARVQSKVPSQAMNKWPWIIGLSIILVFISPMMASTRLHPCQLSYFNVLAGGLSGAKQIGFESTYWCDALTPEFLQRINERVPPGAKTIGLALPNEVLVHYQERGLLRQDIVCGGDPPYDFHLLQSRQGMFTDIEWYFYRNRRPLESVERDGVMLFGLYGPLQ